jgi:hypothetical protein
MTFKSGFSLSGEELLFKEWLVESPFVVSGFSYGAILAFEEALSSDKRIDTVQLFSPAFFQTQKVSYKKMQLRYYKQDASAYETAFLKNVAAPSDVDLRPFFKKSTPEALHELLAYEWSSEKLEALRKKGTKIEVYLGAKDIIIDANAAKDFFNPFATIYFFNHYGHLLKGA